MISNITTLTYHNAKTSQQKYSVLKYHYSILYLQPSITVSLEGQVDEMNSTFPSSDHDDLADSFLFFTPLPLTSKHHKVHEDVSPVTLSTEWPRLARLLLLSSLAVIGSVGNVFMISSVMIEDHLKKAGIHGKANLTSPAWFPRYNPRLLDIAIKFTFHLSLSLTRPSLGGAQFPRQTLR
jgi:hypothetical protein